MDLITIYQTFKTEKDCHTYLINLRWQAGIECVYCKSNKVYRRTQGNGLKCRSCNSSFTVTTGTIFHSTKLPLIKWLMAISQILSAKKGISSLQLARTINVNKNTAWFMQKRLRQAMSSDIILKGIVEIDETYIGGELKNMHEQQKIKRNPHKCGMVHKTPVLGMIEQATKKVRLDVLSHANGQNIKPIVFTKVDKQSEVVTDGFGAYYGLDNYFQKHIKLNHEKKKRKEGIYHTSTIEGFFAIIKRAVIGQYHILTKKHLQSYMNEIAFKQNNGNINAFEMLLRRACAV